MTTKFSRRQFLQLSATGAAGLAMAACANIPVPQAPAGATQAPTAQPAAPEAKVVRILLDSWATGEMPFDTFAREFNESHPGVNIQLQSTFEGWDTKVMAQISAGNLEWSAGGIASSASSSLPRWILSGMIQPMDDYIKGAAEKGASDVLTDMIPTIRKASEHEGKFWGFPYSFENISFNWRTDHFGEVGATAAPATWDEWLSIARKLKAWGEEEKIIATSFIPDLDASVGAMIYSALENPFNEDQLLKWDAPEAIDALELYRTFVWEGLTPPHGFDGWLDLYYAGKLSSVQAQSSRGVWGQLAFGTDKVVTSQIPTYKKGSGAGTAFWGNCIGLLTKGPSPQDAMNYLIFTMGPQNERWQKQCMQTGKTPVFQSAYKLIEADPQFRNYAWMVEMRNQVDRSMSRPFNNYFSIQDTFYRKYLVEFVEPNSTMTAEACAAAIVKDAKDEIAKQKA
ncbi:MAG: extracellular solute-binding protein [Chloroflexi bacterium]|nr:extracellular solute-binding protein [Chloroflexota bacterium]